MSYKISLIIPVYKAEQFIEKCLLSVCNQTLEEFQIIIVDDCSPDGSLEVAKKVLHRYPEREKHTKIISFNINKGISNVRKYALSIANGDYIASLDSDDFLEHDALEVLLSAAVNNLADIVFSDYFVNNNKGVSLVKQEPCRTKLEIMSQLLEDKLHGSLCNKLFRADILRKVHVLDEVDMSEDLLICIQAVYFSQKIVYVPNPYLHYVQYNVDSYTSKFSEKKIVDMINGIDFLNSFFIKENIKNNLNESLLHRKLLVKSDALTYSCKRNRDKYIALFENDILFSNFNNEINLYKNILFFLLTKKIYSLVHLIISVRNYIVKIRGRIRWKFW